MIHAVKGQTERNAAVTVGFLLVVRDPNITAENGFDAVSQRVRKETQSPENIHVVGKAQRHIPAAYRLFQHRIQPHDAVGDGIFGMKTQMNKLAGHGFGSIRKK